MGSHENTVKKVFGRRARIYATCASLTNTAILARLVELAAPQPGWSALDVATGAGHTAFALAPHVSSVTGVDLTPEMLREAAKLASERSVPNVRFLVGDVHALPFAAGSFDLVTCRRAAHHFGDIAQALREMRRVLKAGGTLVVDDRSVPEDDFVDACLNGIDRLHDASHVREYRPSEWRRMLAEYGFEVSVLEAYEENRPLSTLTEGVARGNVRRILRILDGLNDGQRVALHLTGKGDEARMNQWYVMIVAAAD